MIDIAAADMLPQLTSKWYDYKKLLWKVVYWLYVDFHNFTQVQSLSSICFTYLCIACAGIKVFVGGVGRSNSHILYPPATTSTKYLCICIFVFLCICIFVFLYLHVWHMEMSFLISLNNPLFKNMPYVGSFWQFVICCICVFVYLYFCICVFDTWKYNFWYPWTICFSKIYHMLGLSGTSSYAVFVYLCIL